MNNILLIEDHTSLRQALALLLEEEPGFTVVGQAGSLAEARGSLEGIDIAILDLGLPDGDGITLISELREANPRRRSSPGCAVLVLTASLDRELFVRAVEAGAAGFLHKTAGVWEIIDAVRRLCAGETLVSAEEVSELLSLSERRRSRWDPAARAALESLTPREKQVLRALADGLDNKGIARRLGITIETERNYLSSVFSKLGVHSRLQALVFALRHGIVEIPQTSKPSAGR
ncbi:response regulator [Rubrobacter marinus]|uniref:Response regulator n=1 Tax=Rubrobacter marinus TaxID=2653852 RepID=A0A6G8PYU4_9ACTN|nr:response regulator transcription factor [Rubrobacter marinus]QIN79383.1 response regulator [Rubrobacter marinus]